MKSTSNRRAGLSLAEVLIAIFVMAIGLLGVLSLFPLGAVSMARAIRDDRTATHNTNAAALMRTYWKDEIPREGWTPAPAPGTRQGKNYHRPQPPYVPPGTYLPMLPGEDYFDPFVNAMQDVNYPPNPDDPNDVIPQELRSDTPPLARSAARPEGQTPSYPVFIDPVGWNNSFNIGTPTQWWVGGIDPIVDPDLRPRTIPRRSLRRIEYLNSAPPYTARMPWPFRIGLIQRFTVLQDDIGFARDGTPADANGENSAEQARLTGNLGAMVQQIQRDGRYSCAFLLQRPKNNVIQQVDLTVVVYHSRSIDGPSPERTFRASFVQGQIEARISFAGDPPELRKGSWILDATMQRPTGGPPAAEPHGYFYRIVSATQTGANELTLELERPAVASTVLMDGTPYGHGVIMDGVVEVFTGKTLSAESRPVP